MKTFKIQVSKTPGQKLLLSAPGSFKLISYFAFFLMGLYLTGCSSSQNSSSAEAIRMEAEESKQNLYVIEREIPGAGNLTAEELKGISQISNGVLSEMGTQIQWLHSYVTGDKVYCVYTAPNEEMVKEHARKGGFPANSVSKVGTVIDPSTAK